MNYKSKLVLFTDLDGTFLDRIDYSYTKSLPALNSLLQQKIPVIFCSSKTRSEQEMYRQKLKIQDPFIVENGGAIFIPRNYFPFDFKANSTTDAYQIIEFGAPYAKVRKTISQIRNETGIYFRGFGDMTDEEVSSLTGLDKESSHLAREREYAETINLDIKDSDREIVLSSIKRSGLNYIFGGRFCDVMGSHDKGKAVKKLANLFRKKLGAITTAGIGDSLNDISMLFAVDMPYLVQKANGTWEKMKIPNLIQVSGIGPEGWAEAVDELIGKISTSNEN